MRYNGRAMSAKASDLHAARSSATSPARSRSSLASDDAGRPRHVRARPLASPSPRRARRERRRSTGRAPSCGHARRDEVSALVKWAARDADAARSVRRGERRVRRGAAARGRRRRRPEADGALARARRDAPRRSTSRPGRWGCRSRRSSTGAGFTLGHFPSSILCSTVGGWVAARSAGQCSGYYGKIEDMVARARVRDGDGRGRRSSASARSGPNSSRSSSGARGRSRS